MSRTDIYGETVEGGALVIGDRSNGAAWLKCSDPAEVRR